MMQTGQRRRDVTALLQLWRQGRADAFDGLFPLIFDELRRLARGQLARERRPHTLQPTELVHEAFIKLVDQRANWQNRVHFYGIAATCMRRILVDHARRKQAMKRPLLADAVDLESDLVGASTPLDQILAADEALTRLAAIDRRQAAVAELKFFSELEVPEIAEIVGVSPATVKRDWEAAKKTLAALLEGKRQ